MFRWLISEGHFWLKFSIIVSCPIKFSFVTVSPIFSFCDVVTDFISTSEAVTWPTLDSPGTSTPSQLPVPSHSEALSILVEAGYIQFELLQSKVPREQGLLHHFVIYPNLGEPLKDWWGVDISGVAF